MRNSRAIDHKQFCGNRIKKRPPKLGPGFTEPLGPDKLQHVEVMLEDLDLMCAKAVVAPGTDDVATDEVDIGAAPSEPARATNYRALAARANYIGADRADAQYAIKELYREMSSPTEESRIKLKRVARYLKRRRRAVINFHW